MAQLQGIKQDLLLKNIPKIMPLIMGKPLLMWQTLLFYHDCCRFYFSMEYFSYGCEKCHGQTHSRRATIIDAR